jgi:N-acetylneuraminic acid mutarotase
MGPCHGGRSEHNLSLRGILEYALIYSDSKYYNDLWRFDLATLAFERVPQQGELPPPCSNFTLTYHQQQNVLLLFGGGTLNKEKLNSIYKLDLGTLSWSRVGFDESSPQPWQRSYHCAEMIGQYLVITGGEYFHDLDDTWLFDLHANQWREIKLGEDALKPKARKFASSFTHGNKLFLIGGCTGKYECVDDCFEMDFSELLESGSMKGLSWKKV